MLANPIERRDNFSSQRNEIANLFLKMAFCWLRTCSDNCWWKIY